MSALAAYRTRITNTLVDSTSKFTTTTIDEALTKVLGEYSRAFPNVANATITVATAGRSQTLTACTGLTTVIFLIHPYDSTLSDPAIYEREDFTVMWQSNVPYAYFLGPDIPQAGEKIYVQYAAKHTIDDLASAAATTVRDDHEDWLVLGAAGQAAIMRASSLNEQWGAKAAEMDKLLLWGSEQYKKFQDFLQTLRMDAPLDAFSDSFWSLDDWDSQDA